MNFNKSSELRISHAAFEVQSKENKGRSLYQIGLIHFSLDLPPCIRRLLLGSSSLL